MRGGYTESCKNYNIIFKGFRIADSCAKLRFARLAGTAAHCARFREAKFCTTFQYMRCFAERSGAKYGRAKCNERTAYTVLGEPNEAIAE